MDLKTAQEMSEREVFGKVLRDTIGNAFWFGLGAVVIVLVSMAFPKIAIGLFVIYAIIAVIDALWVAVTVIIPALILTPVAIFRGRSAIAKEAWMFLSAIIRVIDVGVGLGLGWYMYRRLL